jgi:hypothetical protein
VSRRGASSLSRDPIGIDLVLDKLERRALARCATLRLLAAQFDAPDLARSGLRSQNSRRRMRL